MRVTKKNLIGQVFNKLTVIDFAENKGPHSAWKCQCVCGNITHVTGNGLKTGNTKTCGCGHKNIGPTRDITNQVFGSLTAIKSVDKNKSGHYVWECKCICGNTKNVSNDQLLGGKVKSCGCAANSTVPRDLLGERYGMLLVLEKVPNLGCKTAWLCQCDCGKTSVVTTGRLQSGNTKSCGCQVNYNKVDLSAQKFGRLSVISKFDVQNGHWYYLCKCSCGQESVVSGNSLVSGGTRSCGCLSKELSAKRLSLMCGPLSPSWKGGTTLSRGDRFTKEYSAWRKSVLKRDRRTCQVCGSKDEPEAHHLLSFVDNVEQRYAVENGVCMCYTCHKLFHIEHGSGHNTAEQYEAFKRSLGV